MAAFAQGGDPSVAFGRAVSGGELLAGWKAKSVALVLAGRSGDRSRRVPWYGPSMSLASFLTARLMETWSHGVDVSDALSRPIVVSPRLKHVAHIGELAAPDGSTWTWGNESAPESVTGPALDFCLLVTQRRHVADTGLVAEGDLAAEWLTIAQAFAGPAGPGREPLTDRS
jgi:uncharacterized protein (TIGR03083 family)